MSSRTYLPEKESLTFGRRFRCYRFSSVQYLGIENGGVKSIFSRSVDPHLIPDEMFQYASVVEHRVLDRYCSPRSVLHLKHAIRSMRRAGFSLTGGDSSSQFIVELVNLDGFLPRPVQMKDRDQMKPIVGSHFC